GCQSCRPCAPPSRLRPIAALVLETSDPRSRARAAIRSRTSPARSARSLLRGSLRRRADLRIRRRSSTDLLPVEAEKRVVIVRDGFVLPRGIFLLRIERMCFHAQPAGAPHGGSSGDDVAFDLDGSRVARSHARQVVAILLMLLARLREQFSDGWLWNGGGGWSRTSDLRRMRPTSYHCSTPPRGDFLCHRPVSNHFSRPKNPRSRRPEMATNARLCVSA